MMGKKLRIISITAVLTLCSGISGMLLLHVFLPGLINREIDREISVMLGPDTKFYKLTIEGPHLSTFLWNIRFSGIFLHPDSAVLNRTDREDLPDVIYQAEITGLSTSLKSLVKVAFGSGEKTLDRIYAKSISAGIFEKGAPIRASLQNAVIENLQFKRNYPEDALGWLILSKY
jgi:hypothetical protein